MAESLWLVCKVLIVLLIFIASMVILWLVIPLLLFYIIVDYDWFIGAFLVLIFGWAFFEEETFYYFKRLVRFIL